MRKPKIAIIGPGIVGQATGKAFLSQGFDVGFIGVERNNIEGLKKDGYQAYLTSEIKNGNYNFEISFLTVPTPTVNGQIDLNFIKNASSDIGKHLANRKDYHLVVVKSTVLPGTSEAIVIKSIEKSSGKRVGRDFGICMNPEYLREETSLKDALNPWLIVIGQYDRKSGDILSEVYEDFDGPIYRMSLMEAEIQKYIHNLYNAAKITFFNEMREVGSKLGLDIEKVFKITALSAEGIWNPRYGTKNIGPFSGSCLPKDTQAFLEWGQTNGFELEMLKGVIEVNKKLSKRYSYYNQTSTFPKRGSLPL